MTQQPIDLRQLLGVAGEGVGGRPFRKPPYFKTKKIGIIGCTASVAFAPWHDPSWTLLSHCSARQFCMREPDWYFDMHRPECFEKNKSWNSTYYNWLCRLQTPIFMQEDSEGPWRKIPMAVRYPKERILAEFRPHFTNHVAWMIALAITEGATHLGLFGCQYAGIEHGVQRDSCLYWLGRFEGAGGTVVIPPRWNTLLNTPKGLYGYESHDENGKLTEEYKPQILKTPEPSVAKPKLELVQPSMVPLMVDPEGDPPNEERSKQLGGELVAC